MKFEFSIDRGGTFTDVYAKCPNGEIVIDKLLSNDPKNYDDAPSEAIRRIIANYNGKPINRGELIDASCIRSIRMGTTVATNALLERKGEMFALIITKGFRDLLFIGDQSRPDIFDIKAHKPDVLYDEVIEVEERVLMYQDKCCLDELRNYPIKIGQSNEKVIIEKPINKEELKNDLTLLKNRGIVNIAIAFIHATAYPEHELIAEKIAQEIGFNYISLSSKVMPMVKVVQRGLTACVDAYLTPHIHRYIHSFASAFKNGLKDLPILFMQSDGGLTSILLGSRAILSGPAGGVVGYQRSTRDDLQIDTPIIGFDMGGTSTDVSRFDSILEHTFETQIAGVVIKSPQLDISTVAAGGGSRLFYRSNLFIVGPESVGAFPGPVCYRNDDKLALTDANIILGRILPEYFPACFGENQNKPLDKEASLREFKKLTHTINEEQPLSRQLTPFEVASGFIKVANESMCRPIRAITEGKGFNTKNHILTCFGGAAGQHACSVAKSLNIDTVFIHKHAGILSAVGMALADVVHEEQEPIVCIYEESNYELINDRLLRLARNCKDSLTQKGFEESSIELEAYLNMRYDKTSYAIMCLGKKSIKMDNFFLSGADFKRVFEEKYKQEFGFLPSDQKILLDDVRIRGISISQIDDLNIKQNKSNNYCDKPEKIVDCYFDKLGFVKCNVYLLHKLPSQSTQSGPCLIVQGNSVILVEPNCTAKITSKGNILIHIKKGDINNEDGDLVDPISLSIFSHRFMSIAEQMGRVLQRVAISTNIKERLDFSCALFDPNGGLVSNAPHIPVHLGSMQEAVQYQLNHCPDINRGDVILTNHPCAGGSHLPDLTVITPVFYEGKDCPVFFVANRGHHSDIGGITPGSMPANSTSLSQEGSVFVSFKIVEKNVFQEAKLIEQLQALGKVAGNFGSRNIKDNINDLKAQIAANNRGISLCSELIKQYTLKNVQNYMKHIQNNASLAVTQMLQDFVKKHQCTQFEATDYMDDGTKINLKINIDPKMGKATFDFTGSGLEVYGNTNAPKAITLSAIIYCLRCLVGYDIPLNQGCLLPINFIITKGSILWPSDAAAVVGGNVLTSQRIVDVILKAFKACAASQGCMNNVTFGDESMGYYETVAGGSGKMMINKLYNNVINNEILFSFSSCRRRRNLEWTKWSSCSHDKHQNH